MVEDKLIIAEHVPFGKSAVYKCKDGFFIENNEIDPTKTESSIRCLTSGEYNIPDEWPNCTETVSCGKPLDPPVGGTIEWITGSENDDVYNTTVRNVMVLIQWVITLKFKLNYKLP